MLKSMVLTEKRMICVNVSFSDESKMISVLIVVVVVVAEVVAEVVEKPNHYCFLLLLVFACLWIDANGISKTQPRR